MTQNPGVRVGQVSYGRGVFSTRQFSAGEIVGVIPGDVIDDEDYSSDYCMDLGGSLSLEPSGPFRYINHACQPNAGLFIIAPARPDENPVIIVEACRRIRPGEEITIDYAWAAEHAIPCRCQSEDCRGWIVAKHEIHLLKTDPIGPGR